MLASDLFCIVCSHSQDLATFSLPLTYTPIPPLNHHSSRAVQPTMYKLHTICATLRMCTFLIHEAPSRPFAQTPPSSGMQFLPFQSCNSISGHALPLSPAMLPLLPRPMLPLPKSCTPAVHLSPPSVLRVPTLTSSHPKPFLHPSLPMEVMRL